MEECEVLCTRLVIYQFLSINLVKKKHFIYTESPAGNYGEWRI